MRARGILILGIFLSINVVAHAQEGTDEFLSSVNQHLKDGESKKALKVLESAISKDKENYILLSKQAEIYHLQGRDEEAMDRVQRILQRRPECCPALLIAARLTSEQKELDEALVFIDKAFESKPDYQTQQSLFAVKGKILLYKKEFLDAEKCLLIASSSDEVTLATMCDLAKALSKNDKLDESMVVLESSIERYGIQMSSMILAGSIEIKRGNFDDAINYLDLALTLDGENPTALASLAEAYMYIDDLPTAEVNLKKAIESDESSAFAHKIYGDFLMKQENNQEACGEYNLAVANGYAEEHGQVEILFLLNESCGLD